MTSTTSNLKSSLSSLKNVFKRAAKKVSTFVGAFILAATLSTGAAALSVNKYNAHEKLESSATQSYQDYAAENNMPQELVEATPASEKIRVYKNNTATILFKAGQMSSWETSSMLNQLEEDDKLGRVWTLAVKGTHNFAKRLLESYEQHQNMHPLGAYAIPDYSENGKCYVNPPGSMGLLEFTSMFTSIPQSHLSNLQDVKDIDPAIPVMIHEASHCSNNPTQSIVEYYMSSFTLQGESRADNDAIKAIEKHYEDTIMPELLFHIRSIAPLTYPIGVDAEHGTAPMMDMPLNSNKKFSKEDIYAGYVHLNELVKAETKYYHPFFNGPYYIATYDAIDKILASDQDITEATRHVAELYMKGVEYLAPQMVAPQQPDGIIHNMKHNMLKIFS